MSKVEQQRPVPYSETAERSLLGAALYSASAREVLMGALTPADFYVPEHQTIAAAIAELTRVGSGVDPVLVANWLQDRQKPDVLGDPGYLTTLMLDTPSVSNASSYAKVISDLAARRRLAAAASAIAALSKDQHRDLPDLLEAAREALRDVEVPFRSEGPDLNLEQFLAQDFDYDWLIPGLIERLDRFIITGLEGLGKSQALQQWAVQFAAGIHPWTLKRVAPISVLVIDVENGPAQAHRSFRSLAIKAGLRMQRTLDGEGFDADRLRLRIHPAGVDLLKPSGRRWFADRLAANAPIDLLITGPLYKLHGGKPNDEEPAAQMARFFDELRVRFGCAMIFEAHSPHAGDGTSRTLRPYGASLWMRWPEFGMGIRSATPHDLRVRKEEDMPKDVFALDEWRGARDITRDWPFLIQRGGRWPWTAYNAKEDF